MIIYTLIIDHRHGTNIFNFLSEAERDAALYEHVRDSWHDDDGALEPLSPAQAIAQYFEAQSWHGEWYVTEETAFPVLTELFVTVRDARAAVLDLASARDPDQLGLWEAILAPVEKALSRIERRGQR